MIDKAAIVTEFLGSLKSDAGPPRFDLLTDDVTYTRCCCPMSTRPDSLR